MEVKEYIKNLVKKAGIAQKIAENFDQKKVDELSSACAWFCCKEDFRKRIAAKLVEESRMGVEADKAMKIYNKVKGCYAGMKNEISVGIVERDYEKQLAKYIKPMGVIGVLLPVTNGEATPMVKALWALKSRNAIILAPHPRAKETCALIVEYIRSILKKYGAPEDLVLCIEPEHVSTETSNELLKAVDFNVATGGTPMVKVAYSSGIPTIGVGTGNATTYIDPSADIMDAAEKIMRSKIFDNSSSCSSENNVIVHKDIYDDVINAFEKAGAYIIRDKSAEKEKLQKALWPDWPEKILLNRDIAAANLKKIAEISGIVIPENKKFILAEENGGIGRDFPLTGEKLSLVSSLIRAENFDDALNKMEEILEYQGKGHSCGIHANNDELVNKMALRMKVSRILVNQPQTLGNSGAWFNGLPNTMSLGCSTWGNNSTGKNLTWHDIVNYTIVSWPFDPRQPEDDDLFPAEIRAANL